MKVEIEVISKEIIKPSSPTPDHLRHYQLSFLDQISPPVYNTSVIFYEDAGDSEFMNSEEKSNRLKKSLAEILTLFYPLAGRLKDNLFIDCSDEGIPYLEARVKCQVSEFIQNPVPGGLIKFLPFELDIDANNIAFGVQLNVFDCGGIAVGLCMSHKIADALSYFGFVKSLAAIARGEKNLVYPEFVSATFFPPRNLAGFQPSTGITTENLVTKRFVFRASKVEALRARFADSASSENEKPPTRVEALSAFIWSRFVGATQVESAPEKRNIVLHAINLRPRMEPPLPEHSFGNLYRIAITIPSLNAGEECYGLVRQMRESISKINSDYVKKLQEGDEHLDFIKKQAERFSRGEMVSFNVTSLCRFPLYEADFGWGKPAWVGTPMLSFKNLIVFNDTKSRDGIEVYLNLDEEDMAKLEGDKEFLSCVSPTRS